MQPYPHCRLTDQRINTCIAQTLTVEADEQKIKRFYNSAMKEWPQLAIVDKVRSEDYAGDIMPLWQSATINSASQMNKAIPILLEMGSDLRAVKRTKIYFRRSPRTINQFAVQIKELRADIKR